MGFESFWCNSNCTELQVLHWAPRCSSGCKKDGTLPHQTAGPHWAQNRTQSKTNTEHVLGELSGRDYMLQIAAWAADGQWDSSVPRVITLESKCVEWNSSSMRANGREYKGKNWASVVTWVSLAKCKVFFFFNTTHSDSQNINFGV